MNHISFRGAGFARTGIIVTGLILMAVLIVSVLFLRNVDTILAWKPVEKITHIVDVGKTTVTHLLAMKGKLEERYPAYKIKMNFNFDSGDKGNVMKLEFIDPDFIAPDDENRRDTAKEIARFAYHGFESKSITDAVQIVFSAKGGFLFGLRDREEFIFTAAELASEEGLIPEEMQPSDSGDSMPTR